MLRILSCLILALLIPVLANAETMEYTQINVTNGTGDYVYIDSFEHHGRLQHWGLLAPSETVQIAVKMPGMRFFTDVHAYVKNGRTTDFESTRCHVMRTFGNTTGKPAIVVHVHYNGKTCSIDDV